MEEQEKSLETVLDEIEAIIEKMQQRDSTLEDSFQLYEQGIQKLKLCNDKIEGVEKKMQVLSEQSQNV